jgi:AcrR family transcriptional regulator
MILHANALLLDELAENLERAAGRKRPDRALEAVCQAYLTLSLDSGARWQLLFEHRMKDGEPVPQWYQQRIDRLFALVENRFRELAPERPRADAALAARTLWSAVHGVCLLAVTEKLDIGGPVPPAKMVSSLANHYIKGWLAAG